MPSLVLGIFILVQHQAGPPGWQMSCDRFLAKELEIILDKDIDRESKEKLINFIRRRAPINCVGTVI